MSMGTINTELISFLAKVKPCDISFFLWGFIKGQQTNEVC